MSSSLFPEVLSELTYSSSLEQVRGVGVFLGGGAGAVSVVQMFCGRVGVEELGRGVRQVVALWPVFLQWKQHPSLMHLAHSVGVSLDRVTLSISMALESFWG